MIARGSSILEGYGDLHFAWMDYGPDGTRQGGARDDSRLTFDQTRFTLELEAEFPYDVEFAGELEFEHGGTGAATDLEYEEAGEFENEVEQGGEAFVEELWLGKEFADGAVRVRAGRFYVAVGLLSELYKPTQYLAATRPESEQVVIPGLWNEMGADVRARLGILELTGQVVNGLDSTGFSSQFWVASGHQGRFEVMRASDLAGVIRADLRPLHGLKFGLSSYYGGTTRNRPKPDMALKCAGSDGADPREVAPCGYVSAPLFLVDAHLKLDLEPVRARAMAMWGHLANADLISQKNRNLSNQLHVLRSDVAEQAVASWAEVGVNVARVVGLGPQHRLEPHVRVEYYDTMFATRDSLFDNPRFEKYLLTGGLGYTLEDSVTAKLDWTHRWFGSSDLNSENLVQFALGFVY